MIARSSEGGAALTRPYPVVAMITDPAMRAAGLNKRQFAEGRGSPQVTRRFDARRSRARPAEHRTRFMPAASRDTVGREASRIIASA